MQDEALFDFMVWRSLFAGLTEYEMNRNYVLIVDEAKSPSSLPIFNVARWKKKKTEKKTQTRSALQKNDQPCTTPPRPHYVVTKLSHVYLAHPLR